MDSDTHQALERSLRSQASVCVEVLPADAEVELIDAMTLTGQHAREVAELVARATKTGLRVAKRARTETYRLTPPEELIGGLLDGSLRWAESATGDASVLIKSKGTGAVVGQGVLRKAKGSAAELVLPAGLAALSLALQQYHLVEIGAKLTALQGGIEEVLARDDDKTISLCRAAQTLAARTAETLEEGRQPSADRQRELRDDLREVDKARHEMAQRLQRQLEKWEAGSEKPEAVASTFAQLFITTQALLSCSEVVTKLPYATGPEQQRVWREESMRALDASRELRDAAEAVIEVHAAHLARRWQTEGAGRNPLKLAARILPGDPRKRGRRPLNDVTAEQLRRLVWAAERPVLLAQLAGKSVRIGTEAPYADASEPLTAENR